LTRPGTPPSPPSLCWGERLNGFFSFSATRPSCECSRDLFAALFPFPRRRRQIDYFPLFLDRVLFPQRTRWIVFSVPLDTISPLPFFLFSSKLGCELFFSTCGLYHFSLFFHPEAVSDCCTLFFFSSIIHFPLNFFFFS